MKHVQVYIPISPLTEDEWSALYSFCEKVKRLVATKFIKERKGIKSKMHFEQNKELLFESSIPPEEQTAELLMAFRFFYLQNEKTHLLKILKIIGRHTADTDARKTLKRLKGKWSNSLSIYMQLNDKRITSSLLIDLWSNAHYFHADEEKEKKLLELKEILSTDYAKYLLLDSVTNAIKVIFEVYEMLIGIVDEHFDS